MEITLVISEQQAVTIKGELRELRMNKAAKDLPLLTLTFYAEDVKVVDASKANTTTIFEFPPPLKGAVRLWGTQKMEYGWDLSLSSGSMFTFSLAVKDWYPAYDEACAAEMQDKMERSK